jgi:hypothetical protein
VVERNLAKVDVARSNRVTRFLKFFKYKSNVSYVILSEAKNPIDNGSITIPT